MSNAWLYSVVLAWVSPLKSRLKVSTFSAELPLKERSVATINYQLSNIQCSRVECCRSGGGGGVLLGGNLLCPDLEQPSVSVLATTVTTSHQPDRDALNMQTPVE